MVTAQENNLKTYENTNLAIKFKYPGNWEISKAYRLDNETCTKFNSCEIKLDILTFNREDIGTVWVNSRNLNSTFEKSPACNCNNILDFVKWTRMSGQYSTGTILGEGYTHVNDNHTAYEVEQKSDNLQGLTVWTINGKMGYFFHLIANNGFDFTINLPDFRKTLYSLEFTSSAN